MVERETRVEIALDKARIALQEDKSADGGELGLAYAMFLAHVAEGFVDEAREEAVSVDHRLELVDAPVV